MNQQAAQSAPTIFPRQARVISEAFARLRRNLMVDGLKGQQFTALQVVDGKVMVDPNDLRPGVRSLAIRAEIVEFVSS